MKDYSNPICFLVLNNALNNLEVLRIAAKSESYTEYALQNLMVQEDRKDNVLLLVKELSIDRILAHSDQIVRVVKGNVEA